MKKAFISIKSAVMLAALVSLPVLSFALEEATQTVNLEVSGSAMIALHDSATGTINPPVTMTLSGLSEAGAEIKLVASNSSTRLRISSLPSSGPSGTRQITVNSNDISASGTELFVTLIKPTTFLPRTAGVDNGGESAGQKPLTGGADEELLMSGIGLCWSGTGNDNGYIVKYDYRQKEGALAVSNATATVTYTIAEE